MRLKSLVSSHDGFWYDYFEDHPDSEVVAERIHRVAVESRFSRPDWNTLLTPLVVEADMIEDLSGRLAALRRIMAKCGRLLYGDDVEAFAAAAGFPQAACAALHLPSADLFPVRWDVLETAEGWRAVELNAGGALGVFAFDAVQSVYDDILARQGLAGAETWPSLAAAVGREMAALMDRYGTDRVAVVLDRTTAGTYAAIAAVVANSLADTLGVAVAVCDEEEAASLAAAAGAPLLAYQCCSIADRAVSPCRYAGYDAAVARGAIVQAIDPATDLLASKSVMAMTWRCVEQGLLPQGETDLVRGLLPRTVFLSDAARRRAAAEREEWVLKTAFGHGGFEVRCGWETDADAWASALETAALPLLQRRARAVDRDGIGMLPDGTLIHMSAPKLLGLFQLGDAYCGACARQSPHNGGVVSCGSGAALGVVRTVAAPEPAQPLLASEGAV
ncbi:MAG: hypothetical protein ACK40O_08335 [Allosphingosinicella sp.]